jgi:hypothetical protein
MLSEVARRLQWPLTPHTLCYNIKSFCENDLYVSHAEPVLFAITKLSINNLSNNISDYYFYIRMSAMFDRELFTCAFSLNLSRSVWRWNRYGHQDDGLVLTVRCSTRNRCFMANFSSWITNSIDWKSSGEIWQFCTTWRVINRSLVKCAKCGALHFQL